MLHRIALRVLPQLNSLVTEKSVRKRKRWVMLAPGLVAFGVYRLIKLYIPLSDPWTLIALAGVLSTVASVWAYHMGRGGEFLNSFREDGFSRTAWIVGWIGCVYGFQLAILVLAILRVFVGYDFLAHPDGPAMMALIISCTAVTRDAFEIGYLRKCELNGQRLVTFPNGTALREFASVGIGPLSRWCVMAGGTMMLLSGALTLMGQGYTDQIVHIVGVSALTACFGLLAYYAGEHQQGNILHRIQSQSWLTLVRFWVWPGFTFAMTYLLVQMGLAVFLLGVSDPNRVLVGVMSGITAGLVTGYCYYLGTRVFVESQVEQDIPENLKSCPFVMGILSKAGIVTSSSSDLSTNKLAANPPERTG